MSEWLKETGCKPVGSAYAGSNPAPPTFFRLGSKADLPASAGNPPSLLLVGRRRTVGDSGECLGGRPRPLPRLERHEGYGVCGNGAGVARASYVEICEQIDPVQVGAYCPRRQAVDLQLLIGEVGIGA